MSDYVAKQGTTALGIIGTALGGLGALGGMNLFNNGNGMMWSSDDRPVSRYELHQAQTIAAKDAEIALLKSEQNTEIKIADVFERIMTRVNSDAKAQAEWNAQQAVYNGVNNASIGCLRGQVDQLYSMTALKINADNVCPKPMPEYNSWTAPT